MSEQDRKIYFENIARRSDQLKRKNQFYYRTLERLFSRIIPPGSTVLEVGCGTGDLLHAVKPGKGFGIDFAQNMVTIA